MNSPKNKLQEYMQKNKLSMPKYYTIRFSGKDHTPLWKSYVIFQTAAGKKYRATGSPNSSKINTEQNAAQKALGHIEKALYPINTLPSPRGDESVFDSNKIKSRVDEIKLGNTDFTSSTSDLPLLPSNTLSSPPFREKGRIPPAPNHIPIPTSALLVSDQNTNLVKGVVNNTKSQTNKTLIIIDVENVHKALDEILLRISKSKNIEIVCVISEDHHMKTRLNLSDPRVKLMEVPTNRSDGADIGIVMYIGFLLAKESYQRYFIISKDHFADAAVDCIRKFDEMAGSVGFQREGYACKNVDRLFTILRQNSR